MLKKVETLTDLEISGIIEKIRGNKTKRKYNDLIGNHLERENTFIVPDYPNDFAAIYAVAKEYFIKNNFADWDICITWHNCLEKYRASIYDYTKDDFPIGKSAATDSRALCFALIKFVHGEEVEVSNEENK